MVYIHLYPFICVVYTIVCSFNIVECVLCNVVYRIVFVMKNTLNIECLFVYRIVVYVVYIGLRYSFC